MLTNQETKKETLNQLYIDLLHEYHNGDATVNPGIKLVLSIVDEKLKEME